MTRRLARSPGFLPSAVCLALSLFAGCKCAVQRLPTYIDFPDTDSCAVGRTLCGDCSSCDPTANDNSCISCGCYDLTSHPDNCGACGTMCLSGQVCVGGQCTTSCPSGSTVCDSVCVNLSTSALHCGSCNTACPNGQVCTNGACGTACSGGAVPAPTFGNEGPTTSCVSLRSNSNNCGSVGNACADGQACADGNVTRTVTGNGQTTTIDTYDGDELVQEVVQDQGG